MKRTKTYPNQRLQLNDYEAVAALVLEELIRQNRVGLLPSGRTTGAAVTSARIFRGFTMTAIVGGTCRLNQGSGIFGFFHDGALDHGALLGEESPAYYDLDFSALPDGNYFVYVRMTSGPTDAENRVFWNPAGTPAEYVDNVATRETPSWEYTIRAIAAAPPGHGEWVRVWQVTVAAGAITGHDDLRHFFVEGDAASAAWTSEWGSATDRNDDRATYGVGDGHQFVQAMRTQVGEIIGVAMPSGLQAWHKQREISLHDLFGSHYGQATPTYAGNHKNPLKIGVPGTSEWQISGADYLAGIYQLLKIVSNESPADATVGIAAFTAGGMRVQLDPAPGSALNSTVGVVCGSESDYKLAFIGDGSGHNYSFWIMTDGASHDLELRSGHAATNPGLILGCEAAGGAGDDEGAYQLTERIVLVTVPLRQFTSQYTANNWRPLDITPTDGGCIYCPAAGLSMVNRLEYHHLPHQAVLRSVYVMWMQSAAVAAGNNMRLHVYRHRMGFTAIGDIPLLGVTSSLTGQGAVNHFVEYAAGARTTNIQQFAAGAAVADRTFDQHTDKLVLTLESPDADGKDCRVYWIRLEFAYTIAQPFPAV